MSTKWNAHPLDNCPPNNSSYEIPPRQLNPRLTPLNNYHQIIHLWSNYPSDNCPLEIRPRTIASGFLPPVEYCFELSSFKSELNISKVSISTGYHCKPIIKAVVIFYIFSLVLLCYWVTKLRLIFSWTCSELLSALAADYFSNYSKHVYLKCGNVPVSHKINIQWQSKNLANMPKIACKWSTVKSAK